MSVSRVSPVRTCVGCRVRAAKADLLRVRVVEGVVTPDAQGRLPGRGAHLHPDPRCLDLAERRRAFSRALRLSGSLDVSVLRGHLEAAADEQKSSGSDEHRIGSES